MLTTSPILEKGCRRPWSVIGVIGVEEVLSSEGRGWPKATGVHGRLVMDGGDGSEDAALSSRRVVGHGWLGMEGDAGSVSEEWHELVVGPERSVPLIVVMDGRAGSEERLEGVLGPERSVPLIVVMDGRAGSEERLGWEEGVEGADEVLASGGRVWAITRMEGAGGDKPLEEGTRARGAMGVTGRMPPRAPPLKERREPRPREGVEYGWEGRTVGLENPAPVVMGGGANSEEWHGSGMDMEGAGETPPSEGRV